jgi:hypothetical protein
MLWTTPLLPAWMDRHQHAPCEYAAWVAGKLDVPLALLHVLEKMNNRQFLT